MNHASSWYLGGVSRGPRELPTALPGVGNFLGSAVRWPWTLRQLGPARFWCPRHPQGQRRCPFWHARARGSGAQLLCFSRHANKAARPHGHAYCTGASASRETLKFGIFVIAFLISMRYNAASNVVVQTLIVIVEF